MLTTHFFGPRIFFGGGKLSTIINGIWRFGHQLLICRVIVDGRNFKGTIFRKNKFGWEGFWDSSKELCDLSYLENCSIFDRKSVARRRLRMTSVSIEIVLYFLFVTQLFYVCPKNLLLLANHSARINLTRFFFSKWADVFNCDIENSKTVKKNSEN